MKKVFLILTIVVLVIAGGIATITWLYLSTDECDKDAFENSTFINGVNCSYLTYDEAEQKLAEERNGSSIVLSGELDETLAVYENFNFEYDIMDQLESLKKEHAVAAAFNHYLSIPLNVSVAMNIKSDNGNLREQIEETPFIADSSFTKTQDAYVDLNDPSFSIVAEVYGTKPDVNHLYEDLLSAIEIGEKVFVYEGNNYLDIPKIKSDDENLIKYQSFCIKYLNQKIKYELGKESFTISPEELESLMKDDNSGEADTNAVRTFVYNMADKYDNAGKDRSFKSLTGKQVSVKGGTYGWTVDKEKETKQLVADINSHKDVSRQPIWSQVGYGDYSPAAIGDTYVDADMGSQHVTVFKNGKKVFECDCVTGNEALGYSTPTGSFYIVNRLQNLVLRGDNADGTKYESPVKYWCGFYRSSHGFHDADWRSSFGGTIYKTNGSHGCINMPPSKMPKFFKSVEVGMPVIVHR